MILSEEQLRTAAPAVFAESHRMSPRYAQVATISLLRALQKVGYQPVSAKQDRPTRRDPSEVTHSVVLRHEDHLSKQHVVGDTVPQILLLNSHNGRTQLRLRAGLFRMVCANGLVVGDTTSAANFYHRGDVVAEALGFASALSEHTSNISRVVERWSKVQLTHHQRAAFAREAAELRYGKYNSKTYEVRDLLAPRREADDNGSLWATFNILQENTVKGGVRGTTLNGRGATSRPLTALLPNADYNARLWDLANRYSEAKA